MSSAPSSRESLARVPVTTKVSHRRAEPGRQALCCPGQTPADYASQTLTVRRRTNQSTIAWAIFGPTPRFPPIASLAAGRQAIQIGKRTGQIGRDNFTYAADTKCSERTGGRLLAVRCLNRR